MSLIKTCNLCGGASQDFVFQKEGFDLVRCKSCGLLYVLNPPSNAERESSYSFQSGYHTELARHAALIAQHAAEAEANIRLLARHARPGRLLDVGCSTGLFLSAARTRGWTVRGLEYSQDSARVAREENHLPVDQGELRFGTYPKGSFDAVTMWDVIEHLPDPRQAIGIVREILAQDGLIILKTPNADGLFPKASLAVARKLDFWRHPEPPGHLYQFSEATLSRLLENEEFDVVRIYHRRIPIQYSFGYLRDWSRSAKWLAYCMAFAPLAALGPYLRRGDDITAVARRRS